MKTVIIREFFEKNFFVKNTYLKYFKYLLKLTSKKY